MGDLNFTFEMDGKGYRTDEETLNVIRSVVKHMEETGSNAGVAAVMGMGLKTGCIVEMDAAPAMSNELAAALTKFAKTDLRHARKQGSHIVAQTKQGNVTIEFHFSTRLYSIHTDGHIGTRGEYVAPETLLSNAKKAEALRMVVSLYDVVYE